MVGDLSAYVEPVIDEAAIEEDVDPELSGDVPEWMEGYGVGSGDEVGADKAPSKLIFVRGGKEWSLLNTFASVATVTGDFEICQLMEALQKMTEQDAVQLHKVNALKDQLDHQYDELKDAMDSWLNEWFIHMLDAVMSSATS